MKTIIKKKHLKKGLGATRATATKCECTTNGGSKIQLKMTGEQQQRLLTKNSTRTQLLHDLKKIAIAINELCRDLDRVEQEEITNAKTLG